MNDRAPVFVVGMNGSGTTMLADSLGRHPELYMMGDESKVLPYYILNQGRFGDLGTLEDRRYLMREIGRSRGFWRANGKTPLELADSELSPPGVEGVIESLYRHLAMREDKRRWGDKSPNNTIHIGLLAETFPDAQFVHIIRDGRDAAQSFHRRWKYDPLHTITRWKKAVTTGKWQGQALGPERYLEVCYETLTQNPHEEMKRVCAFLGLPFDERVTESGMRYFDMKNQVSNFGRIVVNSGKWRSYFSTGQIEAMERIAGRLLSECGYSTATQGSECPGSLRLKFWSVKDSLAYSYGFFRKYGICALPNYIQLIVTASRQWTSNR